MSTGGWRAGLMWLGGLAPLSAQVPERPAGAAVELPPMLVEESVSTAPWYYVKAGGTEFLSRCSTSTTRSFVEAWLRQMELVRVLVPEEFLARLEVPTIFVLYAQDLDQTVSAEIQRELNAADERRAGAGGPRSGGANIAPSMRLADRDMHASIAYIDESLFDAETLSVSPGHVYYLLRARVPELPPWLVEGIERLHRGADFVAEPITLNPMVWINRTESSALARDPSHPRPLLPAGELFAPDGARAAESRLIARVQARSATQELFVRWALVSGGPVRDAFWRFVARAATGPVVEEDFEACFGFGYADLRDRLSDYLPRAVSEWHRLRPPRRPETPAYDLDRATSGQVARVRGEWERLAIGHVQRRLPAVREPYVAQARRTLHRAYDAGDRDPALLATMGLCEIDAGDPEAARRYLEPAVNQGVVRPRAYLELALLRYADLLRDAPPDRRFPYSQLAPIVEPLRRSASQSPPLHEAVALLAEAWARCEQAPNAAEWAVLEEGARLFARNAAVTSSVALALARHGRAGEAAGWLDVSAAYAADDALREAIAKVRAELAGAGR